MDNILPTFKTFHLEKDAVKKEERHRQWNPSSSLPRIDKCSTLIKGTDETRVRRQHSTSYKVTNSAPPNKRYLDAKSPESDGATFMSPLSSTERGKKIPGIMKQTIAAVHYRPPVKYQTAPQVLNLENGGGMGTVHVFFTGAIIKSLELGDGATDMRYVNGSKLNRENGKNIMDIFVATTRRIATVMSLRQELHVFKFKDGPLGIEVQLKNGKAEKYYTSMNSELLSVNGRRVVLVDAIFASLVPVICGNLNIQNTYRTLGDFEEALSAAQGNLGSKIEIEALILKEKKLPYEDMISVQLKNKKMTNLFKNVLNKGKGRKRGGRFQNMTLEDSDDDDEDEDDLTNAAKSETPKDNEVNVECGIEFCEYGRNSPADFEKVQPEDVPQIIGDGSPGCTTAWKFISEEDTNNCEQHVSDEKCNDDGFSLLKDSNMDVEKDDKQVDGDEGEEGDEDDDDMEKINAALLANPNRHMQTGMILNSIAQGLDPVEDDEIMTPQKNPKLEEEKEEEKKEESEELSVTTSGWDYVTALEYGDLTAHLKLICVPKRISTSQNGWSDPSQSNFMNFINMSSKWDIEVFWVGEDSALISRSILEHNENHVELLSSEHVWCLTARRHDIEELDSNAVVTDQEITVPGESSVSILFRPPRKSIENVIKRCIRVIWIPWESLSFAETSTQLARDDTNDYPDLDFKIFDHH